MSLPDTTVIFVFYNEALSTLLRSIHSVLNRTPPQLLKEIWLIDDGSDRPHLMQELEDHVKLLPKVQLHRQPKRMGLVKARLKGAELATAETFTVLDSHIEVQPGWLEPLMRRMKDSPTRVMMPMIDSIDPRTFRPVNPLPFHRVHPRPSAVPFRRVLGTKRRVGSKPWGGVLHLAARAEGPPWGAGVWQSPHAQAPPVNALLTICLCVCVHVHVRVRACARACV